MINQWLILSKSLEEAGLLKRWSCWSDLADLHSQGRAVIVEGGGHIIGFLAMWSTKVSNIFEVGTYWVHSDWRNGRLLENKKVGERLFEGIGFMIKNHEIKTGQKPDIFLISPNGAITEMCRQFNWQEENDGSVAYAIRNSDCIDHRRVFYHNQVSGVSVKKSKHLLYENAGGFKGGGADGLRRFMEYLRGFQNSVFVVKASGSVFASRRLPNFVYDLSLLRLCNVNVVLVYGANEQIERLAKAKGVSAGEKTIDGIRKTPKELMPVIQEACEGIFEKIAGEAESYHGCEFVKAEAVGGASYGKGYGLTGKVSGVNADELRKIMSCGIPVVSCLVNSVDGQFLNVNADSVALAIAKSLSAKKLLFLTESRGLFDGNGNLVSELTPEQARRVISQDFVKGGMRPKLEACIEACESGVERAHIISYKGGFMLGELLTDAGTGTMIKSF